MASQQGVYGRGSDGRLMSELVSVKCDRCTGGRVNGCEWEKEGLEKGGCVTAETDDFLSEKGMRLTNGVDGLTEAFDYFLFSASSSQSSNWRVGSSDGSRNEKYISTLFNFKLSQ